MSQYSAAAHCAHTMSRLSVGYAKMAEDFPDEGPRFMAESREKRRQARWWMDRAWAWKAATVDAEPVQAEAA